MKHIFVAVPDDDFKELVQRKGPATWLEFLKGARPQSGLTKHEVQAMIDESIEKVKRGY